MKLKTVLISSIFTLSSGLASAGVTTNVNVELDMENMFAFGNMKTARFSDNDDEFIGCGSRKTLVDGNLFSFGFCQAGVSEEERVFCFTLNSDLSTQIGGLNDFSFVLFEWNDAGECTSIRSSTQSIYIPGKEDK